jgi:hypothetical protein
MIVNRAHFDPSERKLTFERWQDVEAIIENNKRLQNTPQDRKAIWRHTSTIPNVFLEKWLHEEWDRGHIIMNLYGEEMEKVIQRKLNDPDYRFLRTDK